MVITKGYSTRELEIEEKVRGSLEISLPELEMLEGIVLSLFELNHSMKQSTPEELKALREKIYMLREDLVREYHRRIELLRIASKEKAENKN